VNPTKKAKIKKKYRNFDFSSKNGRANPKASIVVEDGKENSPTCQGPIILAGKTSNGLGKENKNLSKCPIP